MSTILLDSIGQPILVGASVVYIHYNKGRYSTSLRQGTVTRLTAQKVEISHFEERGENHRTLLLKHPMHLVVLK